MYKKVLELYPDDYLGNHMLALSYGDLGEFNLAIEQYLKILKRRPRDLIIFTNVATFYSWLGDKEKATQVLEEFVAANPGSAQGIEFLSAFYILQRRFDLALQELDRAITLDPEGKLRYTSWKGDVFYFKDELEEASKIYQICLEGARDDFEKRTSVFGLNTIDILKGKSEQALKRLESNQRLFEKLDQRDLHNRKGLIYLKIQKPEAALEEFKKANALVPESEVGDRREQLFLEAVAQLEIGDLQEAEKLTGKLDRLTPEIMKKSWEHLISYLRGRLGFARKNFPEAVKDLGEATILYRGESPYSALSASSNDALYPYSLASACFEVGDIDGAIKHYEKIGLLTLGRYNGGDLYARSFYNLGKIYEQKGLKSKAAENYEKFISLWKDCEPRFRPLVEDARQRLEAASR
jgi:tetratricopeptide (TPR) repeat protein